MRKMIQLIVVAFFILGGCALHAGEVTLAKDGSLVVDGNRVFIMGSYMVPDDLAMRQRMRQAGFNMLRGSRDRKTLDRLYREGFLTWIYTPELRVNDGEANGEGRLGGMVESIGDHPAVVVWEGPDEALWNAWYSRRTGLWKARADTNEVVDAMQDARQRAHLQEKIKKIRDAELHAEFVKVERLFDELLATLGRPPLTDGQRVTTAPAAAKKVRAECDLGISILRRLDKRSLPIWMNHAPRNTLLDLRDFSKSYDIVGCDIYPAPAGEDSGNGDLSNRSLSSVGDFTERMKSIAPGRAVWMVPQGFGWEDLFGDAYKADGRRPTRAEMRFMLWETIVHGARGVLIWGLSVSGDPPDFHELVLDVVSEIGSVMPFLAAPDEPLQLRTAPTWSSLDHPPVGILRRHEDTYLLAIANEARDGLKVIAENLPVPNGTPARDLDGKIVARVTEDGLVVPIASFSVAVLQLR